MWMKLLKALVTPSGLFMALKVVSVVAILGYAGGWWNDYRDGQRAQESRAALCKGLALDKCSDDAVTQAIVGLRESLDDAKAEAETAGARAASAATDADAALMAADAARERMNTLVRRMATLRGDLDKVRQDPQMRELLDTEVPAPIAELLPGAKE